MTTPNPASPRALTHGCICPQGANHYGEGRPTNDGANREWTVAAGCPVHPSDPASYPE